LFQIQSGRNQLEETRCVTGPRHADRPSHIARFTSASTSEGSPLNPDALEVAPGTVHESVQGWVPALATEEELRIALE